MTLHLTSTFTVLLQRNTSLSFCSAAALLYFSDTDCSFYNLVLWIDGSVPFSFGKGGSGVLQQVQYAQVFHLKPAPFCKLFAGLVSTIKPTTSLLLLSYSRSVLSSIFSLPQSLAGAVFSLLLLYQATMGPWILVSPGRRLA